MKPLYPDETISGKAASVKAVHCEPHKGADRPEAWFYHPSCALHNCTSAALWAMTASLYMAQVQVSAPSAHLNSQQATQLGPIRVSCLRRVMDRITRDQTIQALKEQLEIHRLRAASLDNDADLRREMAQTSYAIQLLLDFLQRKEGRQ